MEGVPLVFIPQSNDDGKCRVIRGSESTSDVRNPTEAPVRQEPHQVFSSPQSLGSRSRPIVRNAPDTVANDGYASGVKTIRPVRENYRPVNLVECISDLRPHDNCLVHLLELTSRVAHTPVTNLPLFGIRESLSQYPFRVVESTCGWAASSPDWHLGTTSTFTLPTRCTRMFRGASVDLVGEFSQCAEAGGKCRPFTCSKHQQRDRSVHGRLE